MKLQLYSTVIMIFLYNSLFSQVKEIQIISTQNFQNEDIQLFKQFRKLLVGKNESKKEYYQFKIKSYLSNRNIIIRSENDFNLLNKNSVNNFLEFQSIESFTDIVNQNSVYQNYFEYKNSFELELSFEKTTSTINELVKFINKNKENKSTIIWNNGYKPYLYSSENISNIINNTIDKQIITPTITKPLYNEQLRPDESHYKIEFDSVGIFPSYEISLYWKKYIGRDINDNKLYDSVLFLKECISFTSYENYLAKKSTTNFGLYSFYDSKRCALEIKENYLANLCVQYFSKVLSTSELSDDGCEPCKSECLYQKWFSIEIKGCANNLRSDQIPKSNIQFFQFQCNKSFN